MSFKIRHSAWSLIFINDKEKNKHYLQILLDKKKNIENSVIRTITHARLICSFLFTRYTSGLKAKSRTDNFRQANLHK